MDVFVPLSDFVGDWPSWAQLASEYGWLIGSVFAVCLAGYAIAWVFTRIFRRLGRRVEHTNELDGTLWDMMNSFMRLIIVILVILLSLEIIGLRAFEMAGTYGAPAFRAALIIAVAWIGASVFARSIRNFGSRMRASRRADATLFAFISSVSKYFILAIALIMALQQFVNLNSLTAIVGATALAIGLALQDTLKAVAAGLMLALFRPYRIGDWVTIADVEGEVTDISPFTTTLNPPDNKSIIVPNDKAWGAVIFNSSRNRQRRLDLSFDISYDDDIDTAMKVIRDVFEAEDRINTIDGIWIGVWALRDWSVQIKARGWCATGDFFQLRSDVLRGVKYAFDEHNITIPYPHQVEMGPDDFADLSRLRKEQASQLRAKANPVVTNSTE